MIAKLVLAALVLKLVFVELPDLALVLVSAGLVLVQDSVELVLAQVSFVLQLDSAAGLVYQKALI
ncbi:MAG: hypothetical protein GY697_16890 [Desulfobacterales bacterium]|nr:hypothetical protein [Desulfobacterales bacterium]